MIKYVIEFDKEQLLEYDKDTDTYFRTLYKAKGFNALVFDKHGLDKLTPLDKELDKAYTRGLEEGKKQAKVQAHLDVCHDIDKVAHGNYQKGLDDAWECARKISLMSPDEIEKVFPGAAKYNRYNLGYSGTEAIEKLKAYEQQKADDEIKVGDEVMSNNAISDHTGVVLALSPGETSAKVLENDGSMAWVAVNVLIKTGRHFNFLTPLLNEMKEGAE